MITTIPIRQYRDFWDVPRMFVVEADGRTLLFDCVFDEEVEDYADTYRVYLMPSLTERELEGSWAELATRALRSLATIPVASVRFDPTNRTFVDCQLIASLASKVQIPTGPAETADLRA